MEQNNGLPGAELRLWVLGWNRAGELGKELWGTGAEALELCRWGGAAAGVLPKLLPLAVIWLDRLKMTIDS